MMNTTETILPSEEAHPVLSIHMKKSPKYAFKGRALPANSIPANTDSETAGKVGLVFSKL